MSFPRYERYKESGVEWLDEVPEHWVISRLGFEAWVRARLGWRGLKADEYVEDGYVFLSTPNLKLKQIDFDDVNYIDKQRYEESPEIQLRTGDVLLAKDGSTLGTVNVVRSLPRPATVNSSIAVITPRESLDGIYLYYLFQSGFMEHTIQRIKGGMGVPHLFQEDLNKFYLPLPRTAEQTRIASFLDAETGKIDALIEEQRRLIELLKEKRQAVISHAVTKGLNPDAPMKDSGVPSYGLVPSHWQVFKVHAVARVGNGSTPSRERLDYWDGGQYPWLSSTVVNQEEVTEAQEFVTEMALKECHLPRISPPAILVGITGQGRTRGMATLLRFEATINQHIAFVVPRGKNVDLEFLRRVLDMLYTELRTDSEGGGSTKGAITCEQIQKLRIALPPPREQGEIATWISAKNGTFDALIANAQESIALLEERRSALISAAVTGKIDVRNYAPSESAELEEAYEPA